MTDGVLQCGADAAFCWSGEKKAATAPHCKRRIPQYERTAVMLNNHGGIDMARFQANLRKIDPTILTPFIGKHIAWHADATEIVASGDSYEDLFDQLDRLGISVYQIVHDYVDDPSVSQF